MLWLQIQRLDKSKLKKYKKTIYLSDGPYASACIHWIDYRLQTESWTVQIHCTLSWAAGLLSLRHLHHQVTNTSCICLCFETTNSNINAIKIILHIPFYYYCSRYSRCLSSDRAAIGQANCRSPFSSATSKYNFSNGIMPSTWIT